MTMLGRTQSVFIICNQIWNFPRFALRISPSPLERMFAGIVEICTLSNTMQRLDKLPNTLAAAASYLPGAADLLATPRSDSASACSRQTKLSNTLGRVATGQVLLMMFHHQYMMISYIMLPLRHNYCIHVDT